jgi:hypothetical protein
VVQAGRGLPPRGRCPSDGEQSLMAREIAERVLVAARVDDATPAAVADLTGSILPACGITSARYPADQRRESREMAIGVIKQNLMASADCEPTSGVCRAAPGTLQARRPQLFPPRWGRFFWATKAARRGGHLRVNPEGLAEVNRNGAKVTTLCLVAFRVRHNSPKGPSAYPRAGAFSLGQQGKPE